MGTVEVLTFRCTGDGIILKMLSQIQKGYADLAAYPKCFYYSGLFPLTVTSVFAKKVVRAGKTYVSPSVSVIVTFCGGM